MIQEFGWPKVLGQQCKHAKKVKNESNSESMNPKKEKWK
jgi:hypothetical protein